MKVRDYQHSRLLDVHRCSDHRGIKTIIDELSEKFISRKPSKNKAIKKKHLKFVLLNFYIAWLNDPDLNSAVHMTQSAYSDRTVFYKGKSRFNKLNIKVYDRNRP